MIRNVSVKRARVRVPALFAGMLASVLSLGAWAVDPFVVRDLCQILPEPRGVELKGKL